MQLAELDYKWASYLHSIIMKSVHETPLAKTYINKYVNANLKPKNNLDCSGMFDV